MPTPIDLLTIIAAAKKETALAVKDAFPTIAAMVQKAVDEKEVKTIADTAITIKGDKGDKGDQGDVGLKGDKGDPGLSIKGDPGLSIKGDKGDPGKDGKDGIAKDGKPGRDGKDGVGIEEVAISDDGNLYIGLTNGKVLNAGRAKGKDGKDGKDGKTIIGTGGGGPSAPRQNVTVSATPPPNPLVGDIWIEAT